MVSLLMLLWVKRMRELEVVPRCLADDLLIYAHGRRQTTRYMEATKESRRYFKQIAAKVADKKCFSSAGEQSARAFLAQYDWTSVEEVAPGQANLSTTHGDAMVSEAHPSHVRGGPLPQEQSLRTPCCPQLQRSWSSP